MRAARSGWGSLDETLRACFGIPLTPKVPGRSTQGQRVERAPPWVKSAAIDLLHAESVRQRACKSRRNGHGPIPLGGGRSRARVQPHAFSVPIDRIDPLVLQQWADLAVEWGADKQIKGRDYS